MTREEALQILDTIPTIGEQVDALEMAIQALEQNESAEEWYKLFVEKLDEQGPCDKCKYFDGNSCQHYDYKVGYTQGYKDAQKQKSVIEDIKTELKAEMEEHRDIDDFSKGVGYGLRSAIGIIERCEDGK